MPDMHDSTDATKTAKILGGEAEPLRRHRISKKIGDQKTEQIFRGSCLMRNTRKKYKNTGQQNLNTSEASIGGAEQQELEEELNIDTDTMREILLLFSECERITDFARKVSIQKFGYKTIIKNPEPEEDFYGKFHTELIGFIKKNENINQENKLKFETNLTKDKLKEIINGFFTQEICDDILNQKDQIDNSFSRLYFPSKTIYDYDLYKINNSDVNNDDNKRELYIFHNKYFLFYKLNSICKTENIDYNQKIYFLFSFLWYFISEINKLIPKSQVSVKPRSQVLDKSTASTSIPTPTPAKKRKAKLIEEKQNRENTDNIQRDKRNTKDEENRKKQNKLLELQEQAVKEAKKEAEKEQAVKEANKEAEKEAKEKDTSTSPSPNYKNIITFADEIYNTLDDITKLVNIEKENIEKENTRTYTVSKINTSINEYINEIEKEIKNKKNSIFSKDVLQYRYKYIDYYEVTIKKINNLFNNLFNVNGNVSNPPKIINDLEITKTKLITLINRIISKLYPEFVSSGISEQPATQDPQKTPQYIIFENFTIFDKCIDQLEILLYKKYKNKENATNNATEIATEIANLKTVFSKIVNNFDEKSPTNKIVEKINDKTPSEIKINEKYTLNGLLKGEKNSNFLMYKIKHIIKQLCLLSEVNTSDSCNYHNIIDTYFEEYKKYNIPKDTKFYFHFYEGEPEVKPLTKVDIELKYRFLHKTSDESSYGNLTSRSARSEVSDISNPKSASPSAFSTPSKSSTNSFDSFDLSETSDPKMFFTGSDQNAGDQEKETSEIGFYLFYAFLKGSCEIFEKENPQLLLKKKKDTTENQDEKSIFIKKILKSNDLSDLQKKNPGNEFLTNIITTLTKNNYKKKIKKIKELNRFINYLIILKESYNSSSNNIERINNFKKYLKDYYENVLNIKNNASVDNTINEIKYETQTSTNLNNITVNYSPDDKTNKYLSEIIENNETPVKIQNIVDNIHLLSIEKQSIQVSPQAPFYNEYSNKINKEYSILKKIILVYDNLFSQAEGLLQKYNESVVDTQSVQSTDSTKSDHTIIIDVLEEYNNNDSSSIGSSSIGSPSIHSIHSYDEIDAVSIADSMISMISSIKKKEEEKKAENLTAKNKKAIPTLPPNFKISDFDNSMLYFFYSADTYKTKVDGIGNEQLKKTQLKLDLFIQQILAKMREMIYNGENINIKELQSNIIEAEKTAVELVLRKLLYFNLCTFKTYSTKNCVETDENQSIKYHDIAKIYKEIYGVLNSNNNVDIEQTIYSNNLKEILKEVVERIDYIVKISPSSTRPFSALSTRPSTASPNTPS